MCVALIRLIWCNPSWWSVQLLEKVFSHCDAIWRCALSAVVASFQCVTSSCEWRASTNFSVRSVRQWISCAIRRALLNGPLISSEPSIWTIYNLYLCLYGNVWCFVSVVWLQYGRLCELIRHIGFCPSANWVILCVYVWHCWLSLWPHPKTGSLRFRAVLPAVAHICQILAKWWWKWVRSKVRHPRRIVCLSESARSSWFDRNHNVTIHLCDF